MGVGTLRTGLISSKTIDLRGHMPRFTLKMNVFPSISLESPQMCVETIRSGFIFMRRLIWGVTCWGLLEKFMFSHLSPWNPHKCVFETIRTWLVFPRQSIWGVTWLGLVEKWRFFHLSACKLHKWGVGTLRTGLVFPKWSIWGSHD